MYYLLTGIVVVSILRYFNLIPKMTSKFWTYVDYALVLVAFVLLLSRIPPFFMSVAPNIWDDAAHRHRFRKRIPRCQLTVARFNLLNAKMLLPQASPKPPTRMVAVV